MRVAIAILSSVFLLQSPAFAQDRVDVDDLAHHPIKADFASGGQLELHIRSAEILIVGSDEDEVRVSAGGRRGSDSSDIRARFEHFDRSGKLLVNGGPDGDVEIRDIKGNKNVDLSAGNLTIGVGDAGDYFHVDASVTTGNIEAAPFGESHGGMFRSFEKSGNGRYKLVAHVGAGNLRLTN